MAAGHDGNGWERLGKDTMAAPRWVMGWRGLKCKLLDFWQAGCGGRRNNSEESREEGKKNFGGGRIERRGAFGESVVECVRHSWSLIFLPLRW